MDSKGYDFVIMVKGMKKLVRELILEVHGTFEQSRATSIRAFKGKRDNGKSPAVSFR